MRWTVVMALVAATGLPGAAWAAQIVPGFTTAVPEERGGLQVSLIIAGPVQGPLKVGLLNRGRLRASVEVPIEDAGAGEFRTVNAKLRVGRNPAGTHSIGVEGPNGRIGIAKVVIKTGKRQETVAGAKTKVVQTYYQDRTSDLRRAWVVDSEPQLAVEFFLRARGADDEVTVVWKRGKKKMCTDTLVPTAPRGQVVKVRAYCRPVADAEESDAPEAEESGGDGVVLDDDSHFYEADLGGDGEMDIDADAGALEGALTVADAVAKDGPWSVRVASGKQLRRLLNFSVRKGEVRAGAPGAAPLKPAKVKMGVP